MTEEPQVISPDEPEDYHNPPREPFTREDLINHHMLRNTDYKQPLHDMIDKALIYESAKRGLHLIVDNYFSDNRFLTNLNSTGKGKDDVFGTNLDLERDLIFSSASVCPSDLRNADYTNIRTAILSHNRPTTLRAKGADRERKLQGKTMIASEQTISRTDSISPAQNTPQKKKGFLSFLGGN